MRVEIGLDRCVCIHSLSQVVDIALQVLLYQREIIPEPVQFLLNSTNCQKTEKFRCTYNEVKRVIQQSFCHKNSLSLKEFVIVIGSASYLPKEIYRIPVNICLDHLAGADCMPISLSNNINQNYESDEDDHIMKSGCGEHCSSLSHREKRKIFSTLTLNKTVQNLLKNSELCPNDKVFFFIGSTQSNNLLKNLRGLEEDDMFELPNNDLRKRRNICQLDVYIKPSLCSLILQDATLTDKDNFNDLKGLKQLNRLSSASSNLSNANSNDTINNEISRCNDSNMNNEVESSWFRISQYFVRLN